MKKACDSISSFSAPKGRQAEYHDARIGKKETRELIFSWLSWLAVLLVGAYARRRRQGWRAALLQLIG